jgi:hypothetical protein
VDFPAGSRHRLFWQLQIGSWLLLVPIATAIASTAFDDWGNIVLAGIARQFFAFVLTLLLWRLYRRWPVATFKLLPHIPAIAFACAIATALDAGFIEVVRQFADFPPGPELAGRGALPVRFTMYIAWSAMYFLVRQELESRDRELRLAQAEAATREAELATLRAQVNPHFLYNALTSILAECDENPRAVRAITGSLAAYLRFSLLQRQHQARLDEEIEAISGYLRVEQARFEERLIYTLTIDDAARDALVPTAVLLPLVENAVKYGMRTSPVPLRITIAATVRDGRLSIVVENTGPWIEPRPTPSDSTQIGLANLRRRLALLHPDEATLALHHDSKTVRATVNLPLAANTAAILA